MKTARVLWGVALTLLIAGSVHAQTGEEAPTIRLDRVAVCTGIEDRAPVGESATFSPGVGRLYCFTAVANADAPTQLFHRWFVGERLVMEIPINVKGSTWRCWSRKTIRENWSGPCRVEILTEVGDILATVNFTLESE